VVGLVAGLSADTLSFVTTTSFVAPGYFSKWTMFTLTGEEYKKFGGITAWRATLWDSDQMLGEEKSFLW